MPAISFRVPKERIIFLTVAIDSDVKNTHMRLKEEEVEGMGGGLKRAARRCRLR